MFLHKKRRGEYFCRSLHSLRLLEIAHPVETSNAEAPRRYVYKTITIPTNVNGIGIHQWLYGKVRHAITYLRGIHRCFVLDRNEIFQDFKESKPKRSKRLSLCLVPPTHAHRCAHFGVGRYKFSKRNWNKRILVAKRNKKYGFWRYGNLRTFKGTKNEA